ncbi:YdcH family protein [Qipengyuania sp. DSG2-2]|uniref:YdcH family protein n=1 Tax=Qipengyuania sp. DGS2-2 TaxID=3349631 RepID=UPI0036D3FD31
MASSHVNALQSKHAGLEAQIAAEMNRPAPDETALRELKRKKLRIKEAIAAQ